ncbi:MAG: AI-2E family transporter [Bacteroidales bacterium]|nr:AI-2E family transporter [Bacteroidales bacterium]
MNSSALTSQRLASGLIIIALSIYFLIVTKFLLAPLAFAVLFAIMMQPLTDFLEGYLKNRILSILLTFIIVLIPLTAIITLFSIQLINIMESLPDIAGKIKDGINVIFGWLEKNTGLSPEDRKSWVQQNISNLIEAPMGFISTGLTTSTTLLFNIVFTILGLFFFLLYRVGILNFMLMQFGPRSREEFQEIIHQIRGTIQHYLYGMLTVIGILAILNSAGLWIIGIGYPFFWGSLAALLAIIPYIGTTIGGILPFVYAIATVSTFWQPVAVILLYGTVQSIEGNFITPKVVGSSVNVNPLIALISILLGGAIWGVAGVVLALPTVAIVKLIFDHIDVLKPIGLLMSDKVYREEDKFLTEMDHDRHRFINFLKHRGKDE